MPCAFLLGGVLLASCDALGRVVLAPAEVPAGAITAFIGGPYSRLAACDRAIARDARPWPRAALRRRHVVERRQELDGDGDLRVAADAGRVRGAVQGAEHVEQLVSVPGGRRDRPRAGGAGRGVRARARAGDEPDPAQAERQRHEPGRRATGACGRRCRRASTTRTPTSCATTVLDAYEDLAGRFDVIVIEGAGSVSELNLRDHDLVNLGLVTADSARRGCSSPTSSAAACSHRSSARSHLLTPDERALFRGFADQQVPRRSCRSSTTACGCSRSEPASRCLGVFPYRGRRPPRRRGQPGARDASDARRRRRARGSRSSGFRTSRTPPTSGC